MPREKLRKLQAERLQNTVRRCYENVPFYRSKFDEFGIHPDDIRSIDDLKLLPFTTRDDLVNNYPYGLFAVPLDEVVRIHSSSGTTGKPKVVGYTKNDIDMWAECMARSITAAGARKSDIIQNAYGYGMFTGGLGIHYGGERVGATVIPMSGGNTRRQIMMMEDLGSTMLTCTPSYALYLADTAIEMDAIGKIKLKYGLFGAEPWTQDMHREIERKFNIKASDIYGLSEVMGPGVASSCEAQDGLHVCEDFFIPEIIDPNTMEVLPPGSPGELVFTSLTKEAFPIIRYRTRDLSMLNYSQCPCGRTSVRMGRITGRTDDMLIIRGVNVFPSQIESVLLEMKETEPHYLIVVDRVGTLDSLEIWVEVNSHVFTDEIKGLEALERKIQNEIHSTLGLTATIKLVEPKTIERSEGKAKRVIDNRPKK